MSGSIGGVDASIPLQAGKGVPQPNPLATIGQFANTQNALNQAKLFPGQLQLQQQSVQSGATSLAQQQMRAAAAGLIPLLAKPKGTINVDDVATVLASLEKNMGIVTQPFLHHLSENAPPPNTPGYDQYIRTMGASASQGSPETAVGQVTPTAGATLAVGPNLVPTTVNPAGLPNPGVTTPVAGAAVPTALSPAELATQVTRTATPADVARDPSLTVGQTITETMEQRLKSLGAQHLITPGANPINFGDLPASLRNPARATPATNGAAPPVAAPQGAIATALAPSQQAAQTQTGSTSAAAFQSIADQGARARSQDATLANMQADAGQFVTGPGADAIKMAKSIAVRFGDALGTDFGIDKGKLAANVSFDKLANQIADAQGAGSDARLAVNQAANPSSHLTPEGVDLVLRQLRGNTDYLVARANLAAAYPDKADREGFEAKVGANLDPRVFQYSRLTPDQRGAYFKALTDKAAFKKAYLWAEQSRLIGDGNGGQ